MLSNTAVRSASLQRPPGGGISRIAVFPYSHIPGNNLGGCHDAGGGSDCGECVGRHPQTRDAPYRKYFGVSEEWLRSHGAAEPQETHDWVEQMARRLVAMTLANLHETTTREEERA